MPIKLLRHYLQRYQLALLVLLCSILFFTTSFVYVQYLSIPSGDEPHFLIISQTLLKYHSLNVMLDYQHGDYHVFYPINIAPHVSRNANGLLLPLHSIGAPILWLIPFYLLGRLGAVLFISCLSVLTVLNIYKFLLTMGISKKYALLVSLAYALASPLFLYAHLTFIEPIGAFICLYVLRKIYQQDIKVSDLVISSILLGILPWVHIRFALFEMVLFFAFLYKIYAQNQRKNWQYYMYYILPITILFVAFEIYNYQVWGTLNPTANEIGDIHGNSKPFAVAPFNGMLGIFFDQEFGLLVNFPIFIFLLTGIIFSIKKKFRSYNLLILLLSLPYIVMVTSFKAWSGGWGPPARFLVVLLPLYSFYIAYALEQMNNLASNLVFGLAVVYGFMYNLLSLMPPQNGFNSGKGTNGTLYRIQIFNHHITDYFPSMFLPHQTRLFVTWIGVCIGLTVIFICSRYLRVKRL